MTLGVVPPFDPAAERWGLNRLMFTRYAGAFTDWHRWFHLHPVGWMRTHHADAYVWFQQQSAEKPIYLLEPDRAIPGSVAYPRDRVREAFRDGALESDFACSVAWMMALAILKGFRAIDLFWFPLDANESGYQRQIPSVRYWIGQARGRGIAVTVHGDSALKPTGALYGYS